MFHKIEKQRLQTATQRKNNQSNPSTQRESNSERKTIKTGADRRRTKDENPNDMGGSGGGGDPERLIRRDRIRDSWRIETGLEISFGGVGITHQFNQYSTA